MLIVVAAFAAAVAATPNADAPPNRTTTTNIEWVHRPQVAESDYPFLAKRANRSGIATVQCTVVSKGKLDACKVVYEAPEGFGFGEAAVRVINRAQVRATAPDGQPVEGATVRAPLRFGVLDALARYVSLKSCYGALASRRDASNPAEPDSPEAMLYAEGVKRELVLLQARPEVIEMDLANARGTGSRDPKLSEDCRRVAAAAFTAAAAKAK